MATEDEPPGVLRLKKVIRAAVEAAFVGQVDRRVDVPIVAEPEEGAFLEFFMGPDVGFRIRIEKLDCCHRCGRAIGALDPVRTSGFTTCCGRCRP